MGKDPAFLLYSKDWLQGTAGLMPEEKGVYIDLLAHQHQDGDLPNDTKRLARMVGLSQSEFDPIWCNLKGKFTTNEVNRLVNRKLLGIVTERSTKAHTKAIISRFGVLIRSLKGYPANILDKVKSEFKVSDYEPLGINEATERLTKWFSERLTSTLGDGNGDANTFGSKGKMDDRDRVVGEGEEGGKGEEGEPPNPAMLVPQMHTLWVTAFPMYTANRELDYPALTSIAGFIFKTAGVKNGFGDSENEIKVLNTFQLIADQVNREPFWSNKPLASISKNIQEFYNKIKNPINGTGNKKASKFGSGINDEVLKQKLAAKAPRGG